MSSQKFQSINGLRAISVIIIIISHLQLLHNTFGSFGNIIWLSPILAFITDGQLVVNIFFLVSGFLITSLLLQEESRNGTISLKNFYVRRTLRIFPAYITLLVVYFILQLYGIIYIRNASWITAITYTKDFNLAFEWYTGHIWTLSIEEQFYLFWPLIFLTGAKIRKIFSLSLFLIVPFIRVFILLHPVSFINEFSIFTRIDAIALGCIIALYKNEIIKILEPHWSKILWPSLFILFIIRYIPTTALRYNIHLGALFVPMGTTHGTIANILIGLIVMYSVFGPNGLWNKMLNSKLLNFIGALSYSLYLWQQLFINKSSYWFNQFPLNIICIFLAALASYYLIETPFLALKTKFNKELPVTGSNNKTIVQ